MTLQPSKYHHLLMWWTSVGDLSCIQSRDGGQLSRAQLPSLPMHVSRTFLYVGIKSQYL